jgi:hypothetical protein
MRTAILLAMVMVALSSDPLLMHREFAAGDQVPAALPMVVRPDTTPQIGSGGSPAGGGSNGLVSPPARTRSRSQSMTRPRSTAKSFRQ